MATANVTFSHPMLETDLTIAVNPDSIIWAYGLNTASFPTYGGEVVQILSVYFDDMAITGTVSSYAELERIYGWFIVYMQFATQGRDTPGYNQQPVTFTYPERGWTFAIWPKALPGFRYGRDVVAPVWKLVAAVKEPDATFTRQIMDLAAFNASQTGELSGFGLATADFGTTGDLAKNPWASVSGTPLKPGVSLAHYLSSLATQDGDSFSSFVTPLTQGDLSQILPNISKAAIPTGGATNTKGAKTSN